MTKQTDNNAVNSLDSLIDKLFYLIPPPGKVYILVHALIIAQAFIISMKALYEGSWAILILFLTLPVIIISLLCMTAEKVWRLAWLSSIIGFVLFIGMAISEPSDILVFFPLLFIYIYSALAALSARRMKKEQYTPPSLKIFGRNLPFGLLLLIIACFIQAIWLLLLVIIKQEYLIQFSLLDKIYFFSNFAAILLLPCILYFLFQGKKMQTLVCLAILASYNLLMFINNIFELNIYLTPAMFFYFVPLMFMYYIKTSEDAERYFVPTQENSAETTKA